MVILIPKDYIKLAVRSNASLWQRSIRSIDLLAITEKSKLWSIVWLIGELLFHPKVYSREHIADFSLLVDAEVQDLFGINSHLALLINVFEFEANSQSEDVLRFNAVRHFFGVLVKSPAEIGLWRGLGQLTLSKHILRIKWRVLGLPRK